MATPGASTLRGNPPKPARQYPMLPSEWRLELPDMGCADSDEFGGCRRIEDAYERLIHLGQGTYGDVFQAKDKETGEVVAVKRIKKEPDNTEGFPITALREIKILSKLASCDERIGGQLLRDNIIRLREIVRSDSHESNRNKGSVYMVFDYMDHDMAGLLDRANRQRKGHEPPFQIGQVKCYMKQLFLGLALLQSPKNNILHRDLKNANLLVSNRGDLKIADFGLARAGVATKTGGEDGVRDTAHGRKNPMMTNRVITLWYRPPELLMGADYYDKAVDMWSAGCIMAEILCGRALFPGTNEENQMELICRVLGRPTEGNMPGCTRLKLYETMVTKHQAARTFSHSNKLKERLAELKIVDPLAVDLLQKLLDLDPTKRIGAGDAATHPWFVAEPKMFTLGQMPSYDPSHELTMKKKRQAEQAAMPAYPGGGMDQRYHNNGGGHGGYDARRQRTGPPPNYNYNAPQGQGGYGGGGGGGGGRGRGGQHNRPPPEAWQQERR